MDPDPDADGNFTNSPLFKATVLTVAFSSFYICKTGPGESPQVTTLSKTDTATVAVIEKPAARKKKTIYLTFDDGPNKGTRNVIRILQQERVKASLFVIGEHVYGSRMQRSMFDSASHQNIFEIANHSYTHAFRNNYKRFYELPDSAMKDFKRCADSLRLTSHIIRTPGRNIWMTAGIRSVDIRSSTNAADSFYFGGYSIMGWDLEWHFDAEQHLVQTSDEMATEIDSAFSKGHTKTPGHLVLLAHDQAFACSQDSTSLHNFIITLKKNDDYEFEQVSKYPGIVKPM